MLAGGAASLLLLVSLAGHLGRLGWAFDMASHFRFQYLVCSMACLVVLAVVRARWLLVAAGAALVVNAAEVVPWSFDGVRDPGWSGKTSLTLLSANVCNLNEEHGPFLELIRERDPDVIVLVEATDEWVAALEAIKEAYPFSEQATREDPFGIALYSRVPFDEMRVEKFGRAGVPSIVARITLNWRPVTIVATHPLAPFNPRLWRLHNEQLEAIAEARESFGERLIVAGDFNASPYSPWMKRFVARMGVRYTSRGYGFQPTWPTYRRAFFTPLDHILVSEGFGVTEFLVGPDIGSDHLPVQATIVSRE